MYGRFKEAADKFYNVFQLDGVYIISRGELKLANSKFNKLPNPYELTLNSDAEVIRVDNDDAIQTQKFTFKSLEQVKTLAENDTVDIIGIVTNVGPLNELVAKTTQKQLTKRTVQITDKSANVIEVTMWGDTAKNNNESELANYPILVVKSGRVKDFGGGRSISCSFASIVLVNPDRVEAHELRAWWDSSSRPDVAALKNLSLKTGGTNQVTERMLYSETVERNLGFKDKPDYFAMKGTIIFCKADFDKSPW